MAVTVPAIVRAWPVATTGDWPSVPVRHGVGTATGGVRAERGGTKKVPSNGRGSHVRFTASDGQGGNCDGEVLVEVPHNQNKPAVDDGPKYDATKEE